MAQPRPSGVYKEHRALRCPVPGVPLTREEAAPENSCQTALDMEEEKMNPNSQEASPLPSRLEDQALSEQWLAAGDGSGLRLLDPEEEGAFAYMEGDWEYSIVQELSQYGDISGQELCLWEEMTVGEFYQWQEDVTVQEVSPHEAVRRQEWHQQEVDVRAPWGDGTQQEMEMDQWEKSVIVQELYQTDEENETYQELSQLEEDQTYQELSPWEGAGYQEVTPLEEDVQGDLHMYQWEGDEREPELSQAGDNRDKEISQEKDYNIQELPQWEKDGSNEKLSRREESDSSQGLSQQGENITYKVCDEPMQPEKDEDAQTFAQQGPSSPSSVGTQAGGEEPCELFSACPAPGGPTEDELAAAAAPAGPAEEVEEPPEPLTPQVEKRPGSPARSEDMTSTATESPVPAPCSPPGYSQALLDFIEYIVSEVVHRDELETSGQQPEEQGDLEQSTAAKLEAAGDPGQTESPISAPQSPYCPPSPSHSPLGAWVLQEQREEAERASDLEKEESKEGDLAGDFGQSECKDEEHTELYQEENNKYQERYQGEACNEQELSQEETSSSPEVSNGEACTGQAVSPEESGTHQEEFQGETCIGQVFSPEETSIYLEEFQGEACIGQVLSPEETNIYLEESLGEAYIEQEISLEETNIFQEESYREACIGQVLFPEERSTYQDESQGEACIGQVFSPEETSIFQEESQGEACIVQVLSPEETSIFQEESQGEACFWQELFLEESSIYKEESQGEASTEQELSPVATSNDEEESHGEACIGQESFPEEISSDEEESQGEACIGQEISPEGTSRYHDKAEEETCIGQELTLEEIRSHHELSVWDECIWEELSQNDVSSSQQLSDLEESTEQRLSQGQFGSSHSLCDWEEYSEPEQDHGDFGSHQEASNWEESMEQELSEEEDSVVQDVSRGNGQRPSLQSSWGNDSNPDLMKHTWEQIIWDKPLLLEEDESDGVSVVELWEDKEERERRWAGLSGGGSPLPAPRHAWVEPAASQPCSPGPCPAHLEEPVPIKKRPSRLRRALRALRRLFRCRCLAPQPEQ